MLARRMQVQDGQSAGKGLGSMQVHANAWCSPASPSPPSPPGPPPPAAAPASAAPVGTKTGVTAACRKKGCLQDDRRCGIDSQRARAWVPCICMPMRGARQQHLLPRRPRHLGRPHAGRGTCPCPCGPCARPIANRLQNNKTGLRKIQPRALPPQPLHTTGLKAAYRVRRCLQDVCRCRMHSQARPGTVCMHKSAALQLQLPPLTCRAPCSPLHRPLLPLLRPPRQLLRCCRRPCPCHARGPCK